MNWVKILVDPRTQTPGARWLVLDSMHTACPAFPRFFCLRAMANAPSADPLRRDRYRALRVSPRVKFSRNEGSRSRGQHEC
jgi:hypothetical protein